MTAKEYKKTPVQILLRFHLQRGVLPIPKSSKQNRLKENFDIFNFELTSDTMGIRSITLLIFRIQYAAYCINSLIHRHKNTLTYMMTSERKNNANGNSKTILCPWLDKETFEILPVQ